MFYLFLLVGLPILYRVLSSLWRVTTNYIAASQSGLPIVIWPFSPNSIPWMVVSQPLQPHFKKHLPTWLYDRVVISIYGFEFWERDRAFLQHGRNFIFCTANKNTLYSNDAETTAEVLRRPNDFVQSDLGSAVIRVLGENLLTSDGESWARQRKFIAPNINERISATVWKESAKQATEMVEWLFEDSKRLNHKDRKEVGTTKDALSDFKTVALNVLGSAGYGIGQKWVPAAAAAAQQAKLRAADKTIVQDPDEMTYFDATRTAVDMVVFLGVLPLKFCRTFPYMPRVLRDIGRAARDFPKHTTAMLEAERRRLECNGEPRNNILSLLVQQEQQEAQDPKKREMSKAYLTEDEVMGNLFVFTAAGYDTTANTMTYAILLLAAYPKWQDWICEEIDAVLKEIGAGENDELDYIQVYPKLTRCLALMYETLRLYPPLVHLAKQTPRNGKAVTIHSTATGKPFTLPPDTLVYVAPPAIHLSAEYWGDDVKVFRPTRWITTNAVNGKISHVIMPKGRYVPWSVGPRACPGMKMSQVEFVSVFMTCFKKYKIEAVKMKKVVKKPNGEMEREVEETQEEVIARIEACMQDSIAKMTLQVRRPEDVELRWVRR